jgi:hypothetical protein
MAAMNGVGTDASQMRTSERAPEARSIVAADGLSDLRRLRLAELASGAERGPAKQDEPKCDAGTDARVAPVEAGRGDELRCSDFENRASEAQIIDMMLAPASDR